MANTIKIPKGSTLSGLAKQYNTSVDELLRANPQIKDPNLIYAGANLTLPGSSSQSGSVNVMDMIGVPGYTSPNQDNQSGSSGQSDFSNVQDIKSANEAINKNQATDIANANQANEPPTRDTSYDAFAKALKGATGAEGNAGTTDYSQIANAIKPTADKPNQVDLETKLGDYRTEYGVDALESDVNDLKKQQDQIYADMRTRKAAEEAKPVAMNVITGRVNEAQRQESEKLDSIQRQIKYKTDQLNTKYSVINTMMKLAGDDYNNSVNAYNTELANNISMYNILRGIKEDTKSEQDKATDDARASLQIVYNQMEKGNVSLGDLTPDQKTLITKLELQSGLPIGFYKQIKENNPNSSVVSTVSWTDENNKKYVSVITKDKTTGKLKTQNVLLGTAKPKTNDELAKQDAAFEKFAKSMADKVYSGEISSREEARDRIKAYYPDYDENVIYDLVPNGYDKS